MNDKDITDKLLFTTPVLATDAALLLGAKGASGAIAREAAYWYGEGYFSTIVLSGRARVFSPHTLFTLQAKTWHHGTPSADFLSLKREAEYMRDILLQSGVPAECIIMADKRSHSMKDAFRFTASSLQEFQTVTVFTQAHTQLRALSTAKAVLGNTPVLLPHGVYPFKTSRMNWRKSPLAAQIRREAAVMNADHSVTADDIRRHVTAIRMIQSSVNAPLIEKSKGPRPTY